MTFQEFRAILAKHMLEGDAEAFWNAHPGDPTTMTADYVRKGIARVLAFDKGDVEKLRELLSE